jgi:hypothetical protein
MVEQLFTVKGEKSGNGKERTEQLFTAGREKQGKNESEKRKRGESESVTARSPSTSPSTSSGYAQNRLRDEAIPAEDKDCFAGLAMTVPKCCWYSDWHGRNGYGGFASKRAALPDKPAVASSAVKRRLDLIVMLLATRLRPRLREASTMPVQPLLRTER